MLKKYKFRLLLLAILPLLIILGCYWVIEISSKNKVFDKLDAVPYNKVGIVLGTARHRVEGGINPYYQHRIDAALRLYKAGKISYILVSGDNGSVYYNEPNTIKKDLVEGGIPETRIFLDYAGFRTLDSMVRAKIIFGLDSATVISQEFHNERAIFIAQKKGLAAVGFNARDVEGSQGIRVHTREYFARVKVFLDLIFNTQPRFYGNRIRIE